MNFFNLPSRTIVNRVIPKNAFDKYTNTKLKKIMTDTVSRITWTHKLSENTTNLAGKEIEEIQIFKIELKEQIRIEPITEMISKFIPYHIVFWIEYKEVAYLSTSSKHRHPTNNNISIIDWTFDTSWFQKEKNKVCVTLKRDLDEVFRNFCLQVINKEELKSKDLTSIIENEKSIIQLEKRIKSLKSAISRSKQFNEKVEFNLQLQKYIVELQILKKN